MRIEKMKIDLTPRIIAAYREDLIEALERVADNPRQRREVERTIVRFNWKCKNMGQNAQIELQEAPKPAKAPRVKKLAKADCDPNQGLQGQELGEPIFDEANVHPMEAELQQLLGAMGSPTVELYDQIIALVDQVDDLNREAGKTVIDLTGYGRITANPRKCKAEWESKPAKKKARKPKVALESVIEEVEERSEIHVSDLRPDELSG